LVRKDGDIGGKNKRKIGMRKQCIDVHNPGRSHGSAGSVVFPLLECPDPRIKLDETHGEYILLLGRVTYKGFAVAWPGRTDEAGFAERKNRLPKYVVSTTMHEAGWSNSHLIKNNIAEEVARLKQQPGRDILIGGSGTLAHSLMQDDLIDKYRLLVDPIARGSGKRLFKDGGAAKLKLVESRPAGSGVVLLEYELDKKE
jgi:dihydrofolate reductase